MYDMGKKVMNSTTTSNKILVVDDEQDILEILHFNLSKAGYEVTTATSAEAALTLLDDSYSLLLLDIMMDGMSGLQMAEQLRQEGNMIPIIFLTAKTTEKDLLTGFSYGADDYIKKPFSIKEVIARVNSVLVRSSLPQDYSGSIITAGPLTIDTEAKSVSADGKPIELTRTEYDILHLLVQNEGRLLSREKILDAVWCEKQNVIDRTVDVHIARMRKKLGPFAPLISNRVGFGYYFKSDALN